MDQIKYSSLPASEGDAEEGKQLLRGQLNTTVERTWSNGTKWWCRRYSLPAWLVMLNGIIFIMSVALVMIAVSLERQRFVERNWLLKLTSQPSPLLDEIDIPLVTKKMNATLLDTEPKSIWRQPPSPEVDAAWNRIQTREPVAISRMDVLRMGKDPADAVKWPESFGFGPDAYIAKLDVLHQIHCLNTLRMNLRNNFDYYYGTAFPGDTPTDTFHDLHVAHCVHILLENLMCVANVDLYTHVWIDAQTHPYADFNINHTCRNFDAILAWQESHAVPIGMIEEVTRPDDYQVHIMNHEFKEALHWYDDHPDDGVQGGETG